jgi:subtilase family serine protease
MKALTRSQAGLAVTSCLALTLATPGLAHAGSSPSRHVLGHAPGWTARAHHLGRLSGSTQQDLSFVLNLRDAAGAEALADAVSTPSSAQYGHYLTAAQWRARYAPTDAQVRAVSDWLTTSGFHVVEVPANHRYVRVTASTSTTEKALATQLDAYVKDGHDVTAPAADYSVPEALSGVVAAVGGLDTSQRTVPLHTTPDTSEQRAGAGSSASNELLPPPDPVFRNATPCSSYYGEKIATGVPQLVKNPQPYAPCGYKPAQVRGAYGTQTALAGGLDGSGRTVAIVDAYASPFIAQDAATYARRNDPAHPLRSDQLRQVVPRSFTHAKLCGPGGWYGEETLDVEAVHATAPGAKILYVGARSCLDSDINAAVNTIVDNQLAEVVSNSYGEPDNVVLASDLVAQHQTFLQAAAEGISMVFSSGDDGDEILNTGTRQTDSPASDPKVTAVGGTSLAVTRSNGYGFEQGWGTGKSTLVDGAWTPVPPAYLYGGGGGTSHLYREPDYQKGVVPDQLAGYFGDGTMHRVVPDVAMVGDPNTGFLVGQSQTFPDGSIRYSEYRIGGTSLSSPLFAGVVAVADQVHGAPLGFLNPRLYALSGSSALHDVDHGRRVTDAVVRVDFVNGFDASDGTVTSLRTLNQTGTIFTRPGYDDVTGVGSPHGTAFLTALGHRG